MEPDTNPTTFIYVHGAGNKPPVNVLKRAWDEDLFGRNMGARTRMVYYADLLHDHPAAIAADACTATGAVAALVSDAFADTALLQDDEAHTAFSQMSPDAQSFALSLSVSMATRAASPVHAAPVADPRPADSATELLPLPSALRRFLLRQLLRAFIPDANAYFFTKAKDPIRDRLRTELDAARGRVVLVSHSLGTVVAYDVLSEARFAQQEVPLFITVGSPLGYTEIQDLVVHPLQIPAPVGLWMNVADPFDIVTLDTTLADDFRTAAKIIADVVVDNPSPNNHAACGYLRTLPVRAAVAAAE
ncbi:hypothetical protein ACIREE_39695 [Streptomyces sp. NPDC102467]|uniref:hypothetical protein n=1 Tax=Streptomyces sp. NPDC102467 TaxID=3366179 RepID=UPI0038169102